MKTLLVLGLIGGALVGVVATLFVGGLFISRSHVATRSAKFTAPLEKVWGVVTDFPNFPTWRTEVKSIERGQDRNGHPVWKEIHKDGSTMPVEIEVFEPSTRMVSRIIDDGLPFGGTWTWELTPEGAGTRLRITENGFIKPPPFRYIARLMGYDATMKGYMRALGTKLGESPVIEN